MNQAGGFRKKNGDIACLCLKKQRFFSTFCLQIVTIFSTNSDQFTAFFSVCPIRTSSQKAVFVRISPSGTVDDMHAVNTHTHCEKDRENSLKQIGL